MRVGVPTFFLGGGKMISAAYTNSKFPDHSAASYIKQQPEVDIVLEKSSQAQDDPMGIMSTD